MKKALLLIASVALLFAGCTKEQVAGNTGDDELVNVTFSAQIQSEETTKAAIDQDGKGVYANRCIMVLYYNGAEYGRYTSDVSDYKATFDLKLPAKRTYKAVFWADCATETLGDLYYNTGDLTNITLKTAYVGNDDKRDAFFFAKDYTVSTQTTNGFTATLKRPFAQINVISNDIQYLHLATLYPQKVNLSFSAPVSFNAMSGECGAAEAINYEADVYKAYDSSKEQLTLSMDYLFAGSRAAVDIEFSAPTEGTMNIEYSFTNIPYERNYRTNIIGNLLTADAHWDVTIAPAWDQPDEVANYVEEGSIAAANQALAEGKTAILIQNPADAESPIEIPSVADDKDISIKTVGTTGKTLTFDGATGPVNLYITSDAKNLVINNPQTHVELNGGAYTNVTATTSATTLVIAKDVTVEKLTVSKGNVEIHGKVAWLDRVNNVKAEMYASDRATLVNYINWAKSGEVVGLECDIDLAGENWIPAKLPNVEYIANFDGCGHSIKNMTVVLDASTSTPYGGGFYENVYGNGVMKNVTFVNADVRSTQDGKGNVFGIAAGYAYGNVTFENITVKDSKVSAFGKVGGILGMAADPGTTVTTMKNCSLENVEITGSYNVANYIGLLQNNVDMSGCSSTNVEKKLSVRYGEDAYVTFDNVKVINNDEQNPKYVLSSGKYWKYAEGLYYAAFADCYNDMKYGEWKALDGTVDGLVFNTIDAPELKDLEAVATIGTTKYYDLPSALSALQTGQTLEILQAGEYPVQTLSTPANTTIEATVDGVVFNHTPAYGARVANENAEGRIVKNITWNVGTAEYQYFHGVDLVNCKVNGLICTHSNNTYTDCVFYNAEDYNVNDYGTGSTFIRCKFTCPGGADGGAINAYHEGHQGLYPIIMQDCEFVALEQSNKYAAVYIKPEVSFDVQFTNCAANDKFFTGAISGSKLWNVKNNSNLKTKVTVDGQLVYANGTVLNITTADQLMAFAAAVNGGKSFEGMTVSLGADIDMTGKAWIPIGNVSGYPGTVFAGVFDGQNHTISNLTCTDNTENYACAALFGGVYGKIKNVKLSNVNISSKHYAGGIGAYCSSSLMDIENCHVIGGTITSSPELLGGEYDNGDKVGGIVGYAGEAGKITGCSVEGITIRAYRDLGGIAGATSATISNCVVKNSSVIQDNTNAYKTGIDTFHEILGRDLGATLTGNTFENVTVTSSN